ncbi:NAD-dependent epimerase/dehydratase family protein [Paenibacillus qinlingensis]|uniref:NAD-dependent epimerase/dehydratase family protein n=1 Tax=Paenibacillus qinlingensis TaxID=1837343 RepID=UPI001564780B|nr:NAD(P)-dependent oxidoreductase [Paenibacillus qinlingensis]NQX60256.1 NAD(P)-dependent oxidoreductase [Paenibacillus qinlingensis]
MDTSVIRSKTIAILGATSHIAKNLIYYLSENENFHLALFARSFSKLECFINEHMINKSKYTLHAFEQFKFHSYDVIINCIGIVDSIKSKDEYSSVFSVSEYYDNLILNFLVTNPKTLYINLSSGAAYSTSFDQPAKEITKSEVEINRLLPTHFYGITKLYMEAKHRAYNQFNIVDLRIFGFFSRFIDSTSKYLLTDISECLKKNGVFKTNHIDIVRDYIHPRDFVALVELCIYKHELNDVFDVYSLKPVSKFDLINYFVKEYNLKVEIDRTFSQTSSSGYKYNYYSTNIRSKSVLTYEPRYTSLESVGGEFKVMFDK